MVYYWCLQEQFQQDSRPIFYVSEDIHLWLHKSPGDETITGDRDVCLLVPKNIMCCVCYRE
jgi:hypothetical protein